VEGVSNNAADSPERLVETADSSRSTTQKLYANRASASDHSLPKQIAEAEAELAVLDATIKKLQNRVLVSEAMLKSIRGELELIRESVGGRLLEKIWRWDRECFPPGTRRGRYSNKLKKQLHTVFRTRTSANFATREYEEWIGQNEPNARELNRMRHAARKLSYQPRISVVVPVYKTPPQILRAAVDSVRNQIYENWQLCLADDGSNDPALSQIIFEYQQNDNRIVARTLENNKGIASATNEAIGLGDGEFIGFLDHDDELAPDALYWLVKLLNEHPKADVIYSDEDKLNLVGKRCDPFFKPDWSPDLLLSCNYACHFLVVRRQLVKQVGGLRTGFDGAQDWDFELRLIERTNRIYHIPRVLYHWRAIPSSTASGPDAKPEAASAQQRAIDEHLVRCGAHAHAEPGCSAGFWNVRYEVTEKPKIAIILNTPSQEMAQEFCENLINCTNYSDYEILINDGSGSPDLKSWSEAFSQANGYVLYVERREGTGERTHFYNLPVDKTAAPLVLFMNPHLRAYDDGWLLALVEQGQRPSVGAVGPKLLYPDSTIEHAGVVTSLLPAKGHAFRGMPSHARHYFCFPQIIRNCNAVTADCMLTKQALFLGAAKFPNTKVPDEYAFLDYCMKLQNEDRRIVYSPLATLRWNESAILSDRSSSNRCGLEKMIDKWGSKFTDDPYYSPNLTRKSEHYELRLS
jgi:GT2 family glycosyltransferase